MRAIPALPWSRESGGEIRVSGGLPVIDGVIDWDNLSSKICFIVTEISDRKFALITDENKIILQDDTSIGEVNDVYNETTGGKTTGIIKIEEGGLDRDYSLVEVSINSGAFASYPLPIDLSRVADFAVNLYPFFDDSLEYLSSEQELVFNAIHNNETVTLRIEEDDDEFVLKNTDNDEIVAYLDLNKGIIHFELTNEAAGYIIEEIIYDPEV